MISAKSRTFRLALLGSAGLLGATALTGCGSDDGDGGDRAARSGGEGSPQSAAQVVQATNAKTSKAGSAQGKLETTATSGGRSETIKGSGVMDFGDGTSRIELGQEGQRIEQRIVDKVLHQKPPKGSGGLPGGKAWMKIDLDRLQAAGGPGGNQVSDPADSFAYSKSLSEKDVKKVGQEQVGGVKTTHYRVAVDVRKLAKGSPEQQKNLRQQLGDTVPMDLWIDGKGLMRRQQLKMSMPGKAAGGSTSKTSAEKVKAEVVMNFSDFGTDVTVKAPEPADTVDMTNKAIKQGERNA
ncbi:hypothetical protein OG302_02695 [Streptomyces sp. NBC_01283]|uniref:hypothetical protein n=1 Tax=Streptomyces sp. NBC_01283 TaxID=2903812 RepID=UPI00352CD858|nr:hypothetical protein OG302_02695 [Streptomyces sp. NBC_01283]